MFPKALTLGRMGGVEVRIDPSWLLFALLVLWTFYLRFEDAFGLVTAATMGLTGALLFFVSLLAHELAHALEARHRDVEVAGITLFLFGGVTEMHLDTDRPFDEFAISAVGPYLSLVAASVFGLVATVAGWLEVDTVAQVAGLMGWLNVGLALFNLIPGAPLDGGRVLRSIIWAVTGDRHRAVRISSYAGQGVAVLLWLWALRAAVSTDGGSFVDALWAGFIGWFLWQAAVAERRQAETEVLLADRTVDSLATTAPPSIYRERPLSLVADELAATPGFDIYPVVDGPDPDASIVGALHLPDVLDMDPTDRTFRNAGEVMRPIGQIPSIRSSEPLTVLVRRIAEEPLLKVVDDGDEVRALLSRRQVNAALERLHRLTRGRGARATTP